MKIEVCCASHWVIAPSRSPSVTDEDRERLPLVLDDALLRMDDARRRAVYDLLGEIAPLRQIFLLTCHDSLAEEIATALKVRRIDL
jgi:uncharacterized protein YhaN